MRIEYAFLCGSVDVARGFAKVDRFPVDHVGLDAIPGPLEDLSLVVLAVYEDDDDAVRDDHWRTLRLQNINGEVLGEQTDAIAPAWHHPAKSMHRRHKMTLATDIRGFEISEPGPYRIQVLLNSDSTTLPFYVFREVDRVGTLGQEVAALEARGYEVELFPAGMHEDPQGMSAPALCLLHQKDAFPPIVGKGSTPADALAAAAKQTGAIPS